MGMAMSDSHEPEPERRRFRGVKSAAVEAVVCVVGSLIVFSILCWLWRTPKAPPRPTVAAYAVGIVALVLFSIRLATLKRIGQRGRYQFSLRLLLVFALVVALVCSWLTVRMERGRRQRQAVAALQKRGAYVSYRPKRPGPDWLEHLVGLDFLSNVVGVGHNRFNPLSDADMVHVKDLAALESLDLGLYQRETRNWRSTWSVLDMRKGRGITDAGLAQLRGLTNLHHLNLTCSRVTDEGVKNLQEALPDCEIVR